MKKILFVLFGIAVMAASCGHKATATGNMKDTASVDSDTVVVSDTIVADSTAVPD